jgi:phage baseplate assembly protein W
MASTIIAREPDFVDLDLDFIAHPTTGDIVRKRGVEAVKRSVRNLILTNFYDRPFQPSIGSNAQKLLFENPNHLTANFLTDAIREVIRRFEPRIILMGLDVVFDYDNNGYTVTLTYSLVNRPEPLVSTIFLERIR